MPPSPRTRTKRTLPTPRPGGFAADKEIEEDGRAFSSFFYAVPCNLRHPNSPICFGGWFPRYWSVPNFPGFLHCFHSPHLFCNLLFSRIRRLSRFLQVSVLRWSRFYFPIPFEGCGAPPPKKKLFFLSPSFQLSAKSVSALEKLFLTFFFLSPASLWFGVRMYSTIVCYINGSILLGFGHTPQAAAVGVLFNKAPTQVGFDTRVWHDLGTQERRSNLTLSYYTPAREIIIPRVAKFS